MRIDLVFDQAHIGVRLVEASPMSMMVDLAHAPRPGSGLVREACVQQVRTGLGTDGDRVIALMRTALVQIQLAGMNPMIPSLDTMLQDGLGQPTRSWQEMTGDLGAIGLAADLPRSLRDGRAAALDRLEGDLRLFHDHTVGRRPDVLRAVLRRHFAEHADRLARHGVDAYLGTLHPDIDWAAPVLSVTRFTSSCPPGCPHRVTAATVPAWTTHRLDIPPGGLTVELSLFAPALYIMPTLDDDGPGMVLGLPIGGEALFPAVLHDTGPTVDESIGALLGATRSWVLQALSRGTALTTSELARAVGISPASASEHASALRASRLVSSVRDRNTVLHSLTALGHDLLTAAVPAQRPDPDAR